MPKPSERFRAAAFDLDGTLIDTMPDLAAAVNLMLSMLGARELPEARISALDRQRCGAARLAGIDAESGRCAHSRGAALGRSRIVPAAVCAELFKRSRIYPGRARGAALAVGGGDHAVLHHEQGQHVRRCRCSMRPGCARILHSPCVRIAPRTASRVPTCSSARAPGLALLLPRCCTSGDSRHDIAAARAAGCRSIAVTLRLRSEHPVEDARPDGMVDTLTDLVTMYLRPLAARPDLTAVPQERSDER